MSRPSIRDQIAAKRAEASKAPARRMQDVGAAVSAAQARGFGSASTDRLDDKTISGQVKKAARSGKLDIANLELERIPSEVYSVLLGISAKNLDRPATPPPDDPGLSGVTKSFSSLDTNDRRAVFGKDTAREDVWVECEEVTVFKAAENRIERLDWEIGAFGGLKSIDLSHNVLSILPDSFADLLRLTSIDLSHNTLSAFPPQVLLLPALTHLDLSHNKINAIEFSKPVEPTDEGLGYGSGFLSTSFSRNQKKSKQLLPALRALDLGYNALSIGSLQPLGQISSLRILNLEANQVKGTLDVDALGIGKSSLAELSTLNLSGNPGLQNSTGNLTGVEVKMEGCGGGSSRPLDGSRTDPAPPNATQPTRPEKPALAIPPPTATFVYRTTPAATFDSEPLAIDFDIYLPSSPAGPSGHPLVIWFHGGGLLQGNKENLPPHFRRLPDFAYDQEGKKEHVAVISPNYRLAPQVPILDILSDVTALLGYVSTRLNDQLEKSGRSEHRIDTSRICLSGGSAGGYLALVAGLAVSSKTTDEALGGYRGEKGVKCIAPFYAITDLEDPFWATKTNPVPWWGKSVPDEAARPHLDLKAAPVCTAVSGGPRSILYPYMLQHALFPSLLFMRQKSIGQGLDGFRPDPHSLSITTRMELAAKAGVPQVPMMFVYGTIDDKVQPMEKTLRVLEQYNGEVEIWKVVGGDHAFDESSGEECEEFRDWLGRTLL